MGDTNARAPAHVVRKSTIPSLVGGLAIGLLLAVSAGEVFAAPPASAAGHWEGVLVEDGQSLPIRYDLTAGGSGASGRFSADAWRVMDYPLDDVKLEGGHVAFHMGGDAFVGVLTGDTITGTFSGGDDGDGTFELRRAARAPLPYREIAVQFDDGGVRLAGT